MLKYCTLLFVKFVRILLYVFTSFEPCKCLLLLWILTFSWPCIVIISYNETKYTYFWNLFLEWNSTCFGHFLCLSSGVFHCTHSSGICLTCQLASSCSQAGSKPVWYIPLLCVQWKTPDDRQRNCPKHVEFHSKNKFQKLVHVARFIIRICLWQYYIIMCVSDIPIDVIWLIRLISGVNIILILTTVLSVTIDQ